jgi:hypothetical protein
MRVLDELQRSGLPLVQADFFRRAMAGKWLDACAAIHSAKSRALLYTSLGNALGGGCQLLKIFFQEMALPLVRSC